MSDEFYDVVGTEKRNFWICQNHVQAKQDAGFGSLCDLVVTNKPEAAAGKTVGLCSLCNRWIIKCDCPASVPACGGPAKHGCKHLIGNK